MLQPLLSVLLKELAGMDELNRLISFSVVGLFGVVLTEIKAQKIRELIYQFNKNEST